MRAVEELRVESYSAAVKSEGKDVVYIRAPLNVAGMLPARSELLSSFSSWRYIRPLRTVEIGGWRQPRVFKTRDYAEGESASMRGAQHPVERTRAACETREALPRERPRTQEGEMKPAQEAVEI